MHESESVKPAVRSFRVKTQLRQRLGIPQGVSDAQTPFDGPDVLAAQAVLTRLSEAFPQHGLQEVEKLHAVLSREPIGGAEQLREVQHAAHDLAGQGGTFGFPLVTRTAKSLYRLLDTPDDQGQTSLELIRTHIHLLQLIFNKNYQGDVQPDVHMALRGLEVAVDRALQNATDKSVASLPG